jgi:ferredoxin-nitrite reductase
MSGQDFTDEQKRYLEGFMSGVQTSRAAAGLKPIGGALGSAVATPCGPDADHLAAQARTEAAGKKLVDQEKWKRDDPPFEAYARLKRDAQTGAFPKPADNFRWRFHGLFYVGPTQDSFMCRVRIANGILAHWQFRAVADLARTLGGDYTHVTTRGGLQIREIKAENGPALVERLADIGLISRGAGADNIRNVTGSATAGIDPQELLDTRPYAHSWHHHILNERAMYGLPRKFNVSFEGGGAVPSLEDTNDIAFTAVTLDAASNMANAGPADAVWFRLGLGGITGHKDLARPTGVYVKPDDATAVADAIVRVFSDHGDRTNRTKARLKYVLDAMGFDAFLALVETKLARPLVRLSDDHVTPHPVQNRLAHVGVHPQKQDGLVWVGVALPVGKMTTSQMHAIAAISSTWGDGDIRLTVWQNVIISGVAAADAAEVETRLRAIGLTSEVSAVRAGLVACTGSVGCKFAAADTKGTANAIADHIDARLTIDTPINIHLTGCHHSCAQHYIGDIGMIACRVPVAPDSDDTEDGFHIHVGGGFGVQGAMARELFRDVKRDDCLTHVEALLRTYLKHRAAPQESFQAFTRRYDIDALKALALTEGAAA